MPPLRLPIFAGCIVALATASACGSGGPAAPAATGTPVVVTASDTECVVAPTQHPAGVVKFTIKNAGSTVTEFYVYAAGDRVMGEVENIGPGVSRDLQVELSPGTYQTACKPGMTGTGIRGTFTVTGSAGALPADAKLADAITTYQRYVRDQTGALLVRTQEFVDAVKAGDVVKAKALFPVARTHWERIEPVAEIFGDLDPKIDGREDVVAEGRQFTGFHRIEKDLWVASDVSGSGPIADQLMADIREIVTRVNAEKLSPLQLANGAKELLDEVASGKITGEEDRYSHTDLWDFNANVEGSQAAIAALRPVLDERAPDLAKTIDDKFAVAQAVLAKHRVGEGWKPHSALSQGELKELSDVINALAEPISKVAAVVGSR